MIYSIVKFIVSIFLRFLFRWKSVGMENIPSKGPVIIASNHLSFWDPPLIGCSLNRQIHFMAKEELFQLPIFGWIIRKLQAFPVKRGSADRNAIRKSLELLSQGGILGLFPEGTRSKTGKLGKAEPGLALIALKSGAVVIPTAVKGTNQVLNKDCFLPRFEVCFGKPIYVETIRGDKEYLIYLTDKIMQEIAKLQSEG